MSILFAATYPERVSALVLWGSDVKGVRTDDYPWARSFDEAIRAVEDAAERWGRPDYWVSDRVAASAALVRVGLSLGDACCGGGNLESAAQFRVR